jgi:hypothetical protein
MKIIKFTEYLKEGMDETPESHAEQALKTIKEKIMKIFPEDSEEPEEDEIISFSQAKSKGEKKAAADKKISFADYGTSLVDAEISRIASTLSCKLDDGENWYSIIFTIDLKDAVQKDLTKDFGSEDIENCKVKIKRYNSADQLIKELPKKTVKVDEVDEDMLVKLKIEVDGEETEELDIETK